MQLNYFELISNNKTVRALDRDNKILVGSFCAVCMTAHRLFVHSSISSIERARGGREIILHFASFSCLLLTRALI